MTPKIISAAQVALSAIFLAGYFVVLVLFITGRVSTPTDWKEALIALLGVITAGVGLILNFWFSRSREGDDK